MKRKAIRKLYDEATEQWREGALMGDATAPAYEEPPEEGMGMDSHDRALGLAYSHGRAHAGRKMPNMPTEVWALVLAEAQRP